LDRQRTTSRSAPMTAELRRQAAAVDEAAVALVAALDPTGCDRVARVSPTQLRVLELLRRTAVNVNGLAEEMGVGASSASRLSDRLEALGFIERVTDPRDRREVRLQLTTTARELLDELAAYRRTALVKILNRMPESARSELVRSLAEFAAAAATGASASTPTGPPAVRKTA
jgi:DNA-binding MarR family transcriptional regulator